MKTKLQGQNIFTEIISDYLGVTMDVALLVQDEIDEGDYLDWSEASIEEIEFAAMLAFENLNIDHKFQLRRVERMQWVQGWAHCLNMQCNA